GLGLLNGQTRLQASNGSGKNSLSTYWRAERVCGKSCCCPYLDFVAKRLARMAKTGRHHADYCVNVTIGAHLSTQDAWVRSEEPAPQPVAYDHTFGETLS